MTTEPVHEDAHTAASDTPHGSVLRGLALTALGIVYGDIGTSPLYAMRECFRGPHTTPITPENILGVLSLIFWSLIIVISIKYLSFVLRADNHGEGGILALSSLIASVKGDSWILGILGLFGASLLYSDGMITPSISVLSAVEGLNVATPALERFVIPLTIVILVGLFAIQKRGTAGVGALFGPIMLVWFAVMAAMGVYSVLQTPGVLAAINPLYGLHYLFNGGYHSFLSLGAVFLVVTGGEALYADIGHFGTRPIRLAWFSVALPALSLNYFGQGALLLRDPAAVDNPFFHLAPPMMLYPLVALAGMAAVIASQAMISGSFSLTLQAVQLGYCPRLKIDHTSAHARGQIYIPAVNWMLLCACVLLVFGFGSSSNMAAAYGVAITSNMVITTLLFYVVMRYCWHWSLGYCAALTGAFFVIDAAFFGANMIKIPHGGWFPLIASASLFGLMSTWRTGRRILAGRLESGSFPVELFIQDIENHPPTRVGGTAIYMGAYEKNVPRALLLNLKHNKVLHNRVILLTVRTREIAHVAAGERVRVQELCPGIFSIVMQFGFMEDPDVPKVLTSIRDPKINVTHTSFFLGHETVLATRGKGMARWREHLFAWMTRNARSPSFYFRLPPPCVVELGAQVEI